MGEPLEGWVSLIPIFAPPPPIPVLKRSSIMWIFPMCYLRVCVAFCDQNFVAFRHFFLFLLVGTCFIAIELLPTLKIL